MNTIAEFSIDDLKHRIEGVEVKNKTPSNLCIKKIMLPNTHHSAPAQIVQTKTHRVKDLIEQEEPENSHFWIRLERRNLQPTNYDYQYRNPSRRCSQR